MGMGEFKIWFDYGTRLGRGKTLGGAAWVARDGVCPYLSLKIASKSARADMVSCPTLANGTSG
jgi:phage terminase large subunit-like protein